MTDPRTRIRAWWKEQLATGQPIDLDAAAEEATALLLTLEQAIPGGSR